MVKGKTKIRYRYRSRPAKRRRRFSGFMKRFRRHHKDNRFPLSVGAGLATSLLAPAAPGWESSLSAIQNGRFPEAAQSFIRSWTGVAIGGIGGQSETYFNFWDALNPFNFNEAPAWKTMLWTNVAARLIKKVTHVDPMSKIPFVKKYVKFS